MKPLDLDEIGRRHMNAMLNTATGGVLALACSEIQQLRFENERLRTEVAHLRAALAKNLCPECERIDEEDAWDGGDADTARLTGEKG